MRFADLFGHEQIIARLRRGVLEGRVTGTYLLVGPEGVGKRTLADALTTRLLCVAPPADDACGTCEHCSRVVNGVHPDVRIVSRDAERRDIRIEQTRELCRWLALRPLMGARKVAVIDGADQLNEAGQNSLLKTLEEPPGGTVLLLLAASLTPLLPTVRSRAQRVRLDPLPAATVARFLETRGIARSVATEIAAQAGGSPGRGLELASEEHVQLRALVLDLCAELPERSAAELSAAAQELGRGSVDAALGVVASWYRDLLGASVGEGADRLRNPGAAAAVHRVGSGSDTSARLRQLATVCDTMTAIARNANRQLALETMLLELRDIERVESSAKA
jgi:DNA polymerase-3 subunit delta'